MKPRDVARPSSGRQDRVLAHSGQRDTKPGITGDRTGRLGDPWTCHIPSPWGTGTLGTLAVEQSSPGTCVSGGRRRIVPHPARCSSPYLGKDRPQPIRNPSHCQPPPSQSPRGTGTPVTRCWGQGTLTLQLVTDAVGHFLDLCRQLLQVIFGLCGITGVSHHGNVPREGPRERGRLWGRCDSTHSALGWGLRG